MSPDLELDGELTEAVDSLSEAFAARSVRHALIGGLPVDWI
jgi:hypothetical protein